MDLHVGLGMLLGDLFGFSIAAKVVHLELLLSESRLIDSV